MPVTTGKRGREEEPVTPAAASPSFTHAPLSYFALEQLVPKGRRKNVDTGDPHDASRPLVKVGTASVGSWHCTEGGWDSAAPRPTTESFYEDYVDKLKAELAAKSEDNKKLRASLSKQTAPTTPHDRSEKDGSWLSRFFKHFGRASAANDLARTSTFHPGRSTGGPILLKRGLLGGGVKSAKVAPTPYAV